jgi:hypothetical protein
MAYIGQTPTAVPLVAGDFADGSISEAKLADDAVSLAKMKAGVDGTIISYDASTNPVAIATGSDGQVLTSTGAGSPPAFEGLPASGSWVLIGTSVASASASLDQTGLSATYEHYAIILSDIIPATDGEEPRLRLGDSSGFDSGGSDYDYHAQYLLDSSASYAAQVSSGNSYIKIGPNVGSASGEGMTATIFVGRPSRAAIGPQVHGWHTSVRGDGQTQSGAFYGRRIAAIALDRVQFLFSSGAVTQGRMSVYGIAHA